MTENTIEYLHSEITIFDLIEELHALDVVEKFSNTKLLAERGQAVLTKMPVGDMPDIVTECNCLDEILV